MDTLDQLTCTFVVTEQCNFRCRYCYMVHKNGSHRMPLEVARAAIDYLLGNHDLFPQKRVTWEFIGGEPLLEPVLIGEIIAYALARSYELGHPWFETAIYGVSSNGSLFNTPEVQALLERHGTRLGLGLTLDGPAHVHDKERVFPDGTGTHAAVVKNVAAWLRRAPRGHTKVTFGHDTLPTVAESVLYLFDLGFPEVHANVVFENVWQDGDDSIFEEQLNILGDAMLERDLWRTHQCSLFNRALGYPSRAKHEGNWCGAGKYMIAVDARGRFYPCVRFMDFALAKRPGLSIGDVQHGVDQERLAPFLSLSRLTCSSQECLDCEVGSGCAWCVGFDYDETGRLDQRVTYICKMHKARVRANQQFWTRLDEQRCDAGGCNDRSPLR